MRLKGNKQLGRLGFFSIIGVVSMIVASTLPYAQDEKKFSDEFSAELDFLPPQPVKTILLDSEVDKFTSEVSSEVVPALDEELKVLEDPSKSDELAAIPPVSDLDPVSADSTDPQPVPYSGTYYDSNSIGPDDSGISVAPRRVDPVYEPGQKYIVVKKGAGAQSRQAMLVAGHRAIGLGRYSSAVEIFEKLSKKNPNDKAVLMGLAVAQQKSGLTESAISTYEKLLRKYPKNKNALVNMMGLLKDSNPTVAMRRLLSLQKKYPLDIGISAQMGLTSAEIGNTQDALRYLGVAASMEPSNAGHFYNMAIVTDRSGAYEEAISLYEKALEVDATYGASRSVPRDKIYDRLSQLRQL